MATENAGFTLAEEEFVVQWKERQEVVPCRVSFTIGGDVRISFTVEEDSNGPTTHDNFTIRRIKDGTEFPACPGRVSNNWDETLNKWVSRCDLMVRPKPLFLDSMASLCSVRFAVVNFTPFVVWQSDGSGGRPDRLTLSGDGWILKLEPIRVGDLGDIARAEDVFCKCTHSALLARDANAEFTCEQAHDALLRITMFLNFAAGRQVTIAFIKGYTSDGVVAMEEWGSRSVEPYQPRDSWFSSWQAQELPLAFPGYMNATADPRWRDTVFTAIYWYTRALNPGPGDDGSLILAQAALERITWQHVVRNKKTKSSDKFRNVAADRKVRELLQDFSIPAVIPSSLEALGKYKWDGPSALVAIRNSQVHPDDSPEQKRMEDCISDASRLGIWYLELVLLKLFDFNGRYFDRTQQWWYRGGVSDVPWAKDHSKVTGA